MIIKVYDNNNALVGYGFDTDVEATSFIKRNDPQGTKGFHIVKS